MPCSRTRVAAALLAAVLATPALAQPRVPVGTTAFSGGLTAFAQFEADLDGGGGVEVAGAFATATAYRQFTPTLGVGLGLRYDVEDWTFSGTGAALGPSPWGTVHRPGLAVPIVWQATPDTTVSATPTVQWAYERGASTGDALSAGALFAAARRFSPDLSLGLGVGVFDDLEETRAFPFLIVDWKIDERWRLGNPFRASPTGGAGLELAYRASDAWEFAAGGTWRSERFRLDRDGAVPGGIGESRGIPLFVRASWLASRDVRLDVLAGAAVAGKLTLMDRDGNDIASDDYDPAPFLGLTLRTRF